MNRRAMLIALLGGIILLPPASSGQAAGLHATTLFTGSFTAAGLKRWHGAKAGWKAVKSGAAYNGNGETTLLAPFSTAKTKNFVMTAVIKAGPWTPTSGQPWPGLGLALRATSANPGIRAGLFAAADPTLSGPLLSWGTDIVGGRSADAFTTGSAFHTYRVVVHGSRVSFSVDGQTLVDFVVPNAPSGKSIGLWSRGIKLTVKSFKVTKAGSAPAPAPLPRVKEVNLQSDESRSALTYCCGHFVTNDEASRFGGNVTGRLLSYRVTFNGVPNSGYRVLVSEVTAWASASAASAGYGAAVSTAKPSTPITDVHEGGSKLGDVAHYTIYTSPNAAGQSITTTIFDFKQGTFTGRLTFETDGGVVSPPSLLALALTLAQTIDGRMSA